MSHFWVSSRLSLKCRGCGVAEGRGSSVGESPAMSGGVTAWGPVSGPDGGYLMAVDLGEVAGRHQ